VTGPHFLSPRACRFNGVSGVHRVSGFLLLACGRRR
jgi:hypothetical protein